MRKSPRRSCTRPITGGDGVGVGADDIIDVTTGLASACISDGVITIRDATTIAVTAIVGTITRAIGLTMAVTTIRVTVAVIGVTAIGAIAAIVVDRQFGFISRPINQLD